LTLSGYLQHCFHDYLKTLRIVFALFIRRFSPLQLIRFCCQRVTMLVWKLFGWSMLYEIVPGFIRALVAIIIVSLVDNEPSKEILQDFKRSLPRAY